MKKLTLRQYYIGQMLAGTDAAFPAIETGEELLSSYWAGNTGERIVSTVNRILDITGDDGDSYIETDD